MHGYMSGGEFLVVMMIVVGVLTIVNRVFAHQRHSLDLKHETYRKLIEAGQLDRETLDQIVAGIEGRPLRRTVVEGNTSIVARSAFLVGWLAIFVGAGLWIGGAMDRDRDMLTGGVVVGLIGIGLASLPLAWREVQGKAAREAERRG